MSRTDLWTQRAKERVGETEKVTLTYIIIMCKIDKSWETAMKQGDASLVLCDDLKGQDGDKGLSGREVQEGEDLCILMADSCCCLAETNTMS